jgi:predicted nucleotidyltransferase
MTSNEASSLPVLWGQPLRLAIRESVQRFLDLNIYSIFLFGSEAAGTADRRSDIDLGILGPSPVSGAVMQRIRDDLETLRTLRQFDVVDLTMVDESFKAEALKHAERL